MQTSQTSQTRCHDDRTPQHGVQNEIIIVIENINQLNLFFLTHRTSGCCTVSGHPPEEPAAADTAAHIRH